VSQTVTDDAFVKAVQTLRLASPAQLKVARDLQEEGARQGMPLPLPDALVRMGVITPAQRDEVNRRLRGRRPGYAVRMGPYRILRKLGSGGMGAVYLAEDDRAERPVAIKILPRNVAKDPAQMQRFRREAEAMSNLNHANIVRSYGTSEARGRPFIVMEYCEGESLEKRLKRKGRVPSPEATAIMIQLACGLQYAHARGIVHRDIKPGNIILTASGEAKILDLGLSKRLGLPDTTLTHAGQFMGTPCYISPEQAQGQKDVDGRADIYSLGATYYHLVTGEPPYQGDSAVEIVSQHVLSGVPDPRNVRQGLPDDVAYVIRRMMAKDPANRYPDCGALRTDLERLAKGKPPRGLAPASGLATSALAPAVALPTPEDPGPPPYTALRFFRDLVVLALLIVALVLVLDRQGILRLPLPGPVAQFLDEWVGPPVTDGPPAVPPAAK
jgi:serine/threonine-protein kinase